jgi:hypothetical protein
MREFLNNILNFIGSESLTDEEFDSIETEIPNYSKVTYLALKDVIDARESVSGQGKRLKLYFIARGVDVSDAGAVPPAKSNILIGVAL